jgi:hypothetical protein
MGSIAIRGRARRHDLHAVSRAHVANHSDLGHFVLLRLAVGQLPHRVGFPNFLKKRFRHRIEESLRGAEGDEAIHLIR